MFIATIPKISNTQEHQRETRISSNEEICIWTYHIQFILHVNGGYNKLDTRYKDVINTRHIEYHKQAKFRIIKPWIPIKCLKIFVNGEVEVVDPFWDVLLFVCFTVSSSSFSAPPQEHSNRAETVRRWFHSAGRQCRTRPPTVGRLSPALKWTRGLQCLQNELIERGNEIFLGLERKEDFLFGLSW